MASEPAATFDMSFAQHLATESWTLYGVGLFIFLLRVITKFKFSSLRHMDWDDYASCLAICLYTGLILCMNLIAQGGGSNLISPDDDISSFSAEEIQERIKGSKVVVISEQCMLNVIYCLKICLLLFYLKLTKGLARQRMVQYVGLAVAVGWVSTQIAFFTACRPFHQYWAMPVSDPQCTTLEHYAIIQACFNIPTDVAMLSISLPLLYQLQVPLKQKCLIGILFSMGIFVVIAAILTKVFNLADVYSTNYMLWYIREASVATYVANLPAVWPLLRVVFPCLRAVSQAKYSGQNKYRYGEGLSTGMGGTRAKTGNNTVIDAIDLDTRALRLDDLEQAKDGDTNIMVMSEVTITKEREQF